MFRKQIVSFPQELNEFKHMAAFMSNITRGDIVNVRLAATSAGPLLLHRVKVIRLNDTNLSVETPAGNERTVQRTDVEQRLKLPWTPESLRDHLIILRRRNASRDDYVEDLRVRRDMIKRLLQLITQRGNWKEGKGEEPPHAYNVGFDFDVR